MCTFYLNLHILHSIFVSVLLALQTKSDVSVLAKSLTGALVFLWICCLNCFCVSLSVGGSEPFSGDKRSPLPPPGSLWSLHPQYGDRSDSRQTAGRGHGAAGLLQP